MSQDICQLCDVFLNPVETPCKKMTQIVWKYFLWIHFRCQAKSFHFSPDVSPAQRLSASCDKDWPGFDFLLFDIAQEFLLQGLYDKDLSGFTF